MEFLAQLIKDLDALLSFSLVSLGASLSACLVSSHSLSCFIALFFLSSALSFSFLLPSLPSITASCTMTNLSHQLRPPILLLWLHLMQITPRSACNSLSSTCCTSQCDFAPRGQVCCPLIDAQCDQLEMCTGTTGTCPADVIMAGNDESCQ
ncbi:hypothetical protein C8J56DRAFT_124346 [Mycena floridula]|nr:hypothetical protein C8J56DRAFT_124346 [Mycena floridula]